MSDCDNYYDGSPLLTPGEEEQLKRDADADFKHRVLQAARFEVAKRKMIKQLIKAERDDEHKVRIMESEKWFFMTISPKPGTTIEDLKRVVSALLARKTWLKSFAYAYEQRSDPGDLISPDWSQVGLHVHLILIPCEGSKIKRSAVHTAGWVSAKGVCGNKKHVDVQSKKDAWLSDKIDYIKGMKNGLDKQKKVDGDAIMRKALNLKPYYSNFI